MADASTENMGEGGIAASEALGKSYTAVLGQRAWEVDGMEEPGSAVPAKAEQRMSSLTPTPLRIVEALLFVGGPPLTAARAAEAVSGLTPTQFVHAVDTLNRDYRRQGRPYTIRTQNQGYVLALRPRFQPLVEKLYGTTREARLSPAAIDVLSLVAYRQPASKPEIDSLRGAESGALLRQLVRRGLISVVHRAEASRREVSYGTTTRFLELFGLKSIDDLPQTQDLQTL
jgi:segregation and condensation protein B